MVARLKRKAPPEYAKTNFEHMILAKQRQWVAAGWTPAMIRAERKRLTEEAKARERMTNG